MPCPKFPIVHLASSPTGPPALEQRREVPVKPGFSDFILGDVFGGAVESAWELGSTVTVRQAPESTTEPSRLTVRRHPNRPV